MPDTATRRIRLADIQATPWKNGGGTTREIATGGVSGGEPGWGWRVSLAEVAADGPFSIFPETDRVIAVIEGAGMDLLRPDGATLALEPFQPVRFAGEAPFEGRLRDGPVRDLNVMVRRGLFAAEMEIWRGPCSFDVEASSGGCLMILNLAGDCRARRDNAKTQALLPTEILQHEGPVRVGLEVTDGSRAATMVIRRC